MTKLKAAAVNQYDISDEDRRLNMTLAGLIGWKFELEDEEVLGRFTVTNAEGEQVKFPPRKVFEVNDLDTILPAYTHDLNAIWDVYRKLHRSSKPQMSDFNKFSNLPSEEMARKMTTELISFFDKFVHKRFSLDPILGSPEKSDDVN